MDFLSAQKYLSGKPQARENFPFGPEVAVYKVCHKMFATLTVESGLPRVNLKCDPDEALALRDKYPAVQPGHHMNKKHWNTVYLDGSINSADIERMIDNSYDLVVNNLPTDERVKLLGK
ncbi:MmcQ/YjbR family DNA-binding protein [Cellvibrio polysaccharolyticus]|uniref:MmcQ/YjbR family DNA-binding protein n=1 Tax=Cellvibrio polysaccharolyticus TaxID=2082724 RepID=A0A928YTU2_9GAMM|nr:MmcQ/YjbR family DNA-binding protein [Cellvibrio polysaccharolyticus]MBE8717222.1 MmcQ/YjbR family DNA-binding protein [Cellvibrio polysaccharolyticus]